MGCAVTGVDLLDCVGERLTGRETSIRLDREGDCDRKPVLRRRANDADCLLDVRDREGGHDVRCGVGEAAHLP